MRKFFAIALVLALTFVASACGSTSSPTSPSTTTSSSTTTSTTTTPATPAPTWKFNLTGIVSDGEDVLFQGLLGFRSSKMVITGNGTWPEGTDTSKIRISVVIDKNLVQYADSVFYPGDANAGWNPSVVQVTGNQVVGTVYNFVPCICPNFQASCTIGYQCAVSGPVQFQLTYNGTAVGASATANLSFVRRATPQ